MSYSLSQFLLNWGLMTLSLWVVSHVFHGISFSDKQSLVVSALLLGLANAIVRPLLILFTLPLTLLTFGLFLLVINALMILLVSSLVRGFSVSGFWVAFFASIFISIFNFFVDLAIFSGNDAILRIEPLSHGVFT
ncbi:MAG TPA: phage holin family protein [Sulfuricella sp.]|nr:phage holin family protein [Sulfuricella sp.]